MNSTVGTTAGTPTSVKLTKAARRPKSTVEKYVVEALRLEKKRMQREAANFPGVVPPIWPAWPHWDSGTVSAAVSKDLGTPEDSIRQIKWRLKQVRYPYQVGTTQNRKTLYQFAKSRNLLQIFLRTPLLWEIRRFWWLQKYEKSNSAARSTKASEYGVPIELHRQLVFELSAHLASQDALLGEHRSKKRAKAKEGWLENFDEYRAATLKQILNEAAIVYPEVQKSLTPAAQINTKVEKTAAQVGLYQKISDALKSHDADSHKLGFHLTSVCFTSTSLLRKHRLFPTPETIRTNVEDWLKQHPN